MTRRRLAAPAAALAALLGASAAGLGEIAPEDRRSDTLALSPDLRAMQADDFANPGMLAVLEGEVLWSAAPASAAPSCAGCHGGTTERMQGVAARYPAWSEALGRPIDLAGQVNQCRTTRQASPAYSGESPELLALTAALAHRSRGIAIAPPDDPRLAESRERGRRLFTARMGQLNLSCAQCHDERWGQSLGGAALPQAHPVGYPVYRLEWQAVGSLQRRFRNCLSGVRAEPFSPGAPEFVDLEAYLMARAAGLPIETPAIRP